MRGGLIVGKRPPHESCSLLMAAQDMKKVFITGVAGLIGRAARVALEAEGYAVRGCDLRAVRAAEKFDFRDSHRLRAALADCDGVLHLAAVSRVVWGEMYPGLCADINVGGVRSLIKTIAGMPHPIWLVFASSREIYGTPPRLPCSPDTPPNPENLYARTKLAGETMVRNFRGKGGCAAVVRFSNVFGSVADYPDRVVPAFAKAAARNGVLQVRGDDSTLDFMPLADAADAVVKTVRAMDGGACDMPPVDIVTGRSLSLMDLARTALKHGGGNIVVEERQPFYPAHFQGDPGAAQKYLGWTARRSVADAVGQLVEDFKRLREHDDANTQNHSWLSAAL